MKKYYKQLFVAIATVMVALATLTACEKQREEPLKHKEIEWLHLTTREAAEQRGYGDINAFSNLIFHSDTSPVANLKGFTLTLCPTSTNRFFLIQIEVEKPSKYYPVTAIPICHFLYAESYIKTLTLPACDPSKVEMILQAWYYVPEDGDYDFYFLIENPEQEIYYKTPKYRYTKRSEDGIYTTSIKTIE